MTNRQLPIPKPKLIEKQDNIKIIEAEKADSSEPTVEIRKKDAPQYNRYIINLWTEINTISGPFVYKFEKEINDLYMVDINKIYPTVNTNVKIINLEKNFISIYIENKDLALTENQKLSLKGRYKDNGGKTNILTTIYIGYY